MKFNLALLKLNLTQLKLNLAQLKFNFAQQKFNLARLPRYPFSQNTSKSPACHTGVPGICLK